MNNLFLLICIVITCQSFGQKKYSFDYALQYEQTIIKSKSNQIKPIIFLLNSRQNNYQLYVQEKDSLNTVLTFVDQNGVAVNAKMDKNDFYKAETIANKCDQTFRFSSLAKEKVKDYLYINLKDTIIKDTVYHHYILKCNRSLRYQKRKKIVTAHFIIDKSSPDFLPFFHQSIMYEEWKTNKTIPNGYPKLIYFIKYDGTKDSELKLKAIVKIDKYLTIPEECDYTKEEIRDYNLRVTFTGF